MQFTGSPDDIHKPIISVFGPFLRALWLGFASKAYSGLGVDIVGIITRIEKWPTGLFI
jgi:hypothetical protein